MAQCLGKTKSGSRCKRSAGEDSAYCAAHQDQAPGAARQESAPEIEVDVAEIVHDGEPIGVVAVGPCVVRRMDDAARTFADSPEFARHLATMLAQRLWQISTYLTDLQVQYADRDDTLGLVPSVLRDLLGSGRAPAEPGSDREDESPY